MFKAGVVAVTAMLFIAAAPIQLQPISDVSTSSVHSSHNILPSTDQYDVRGTSSAPLAVKIVANEKNQKEAVAEAKEQEKKDRADARMVLLTGTLAAVAFFQLLVFGWQGIQLKLAVKATKEAASLVPALERAYIFFEALHTNVGFTIEPDMPRSEEPLYVTYRIINYGKTPAILKEISGKVTIKPSMLTPEFKREPYEGEVILAAITVDIPQKEFSYAPAPSFETYGKFFMERSPEEADLEDIKAGKSFLWLSGRVTYDDVFGREHVTPFWYRCTYGKGTGSIMRLHGDAEYHKRT